jgi:uncharacterized RDD family membrane protein YckC
VVANFICHGILLDHLEENRASNWEQFLEEQTMAESPTPGPFPSTQLRPAGFWIRALAAIVDFIVLAIPFSVFVSFLAVRMGIWYHFFFAYNPGQPPGEVLTRLGPAFVSISLCFFIVTSWLYFAFMESSRRHATWGKQLFALYVADERGNPIDFWRASLRFGSGRLLLHLPYIGGYYFFLDCLCAGLRSDKRAVHDTLSACLVVRQPHDSYSFR